MRMTVTIPVAKILKVMFPEGIPVERYDDVCDLLADGFTTQVSDVAAPLPRPELSTVPVQLAPRPKELLTSAQASKRLGLKLSAIYALVKRKKLTPASGGGHRRARMFFSVAEIEKHRIA